jgi:DNA-binding GntR family transcriptional regulator
MAVDTPEETLDASRPVSLADAVREKIERMILGGSIPAGGRLNENALAAELQVSRGPVREAARSLEQAGLVTIIPHRGVFVRKISLEEALHLYDVRAGLARTAGRLVATNVTGPQIDALYALLDEMEQARTAPDHEAYYLANETFHSQLMEGADNPRLFAIDEGIAKELRNFMKRGVLGPSRRRISNLQHRKILECVASGDAEGAGYAYELHVITGKKRMLDSLAVDDERIETIRKKTA